MSSLHLGKKTPFYRSTQNLTVRTKGAIAHVARLNSRNVGLVRPPSPNFTS
jgi:hypothetical protein